MVAVQGFARRASSLPLQHRPQMSLVGVHARLVGRADEGRPEPIGGPNAPAPGSEEQQAPAPVEQVPTGEPLAAGHA